MNTTSTASYAQCTIGQLKYRFYGAGANQTQVFLLDADENEALALPAIVVFEEEDDDNEYEALIVEMDSKSSSSELAGVTAVHTTWNDADGGTATTDWNEIQREATDDDVYATYDFW